MFHYCLRKDSLGLEMQQGGWVDGWEHLGGRGKGGGEALQGEAFAIIEMTGVFHAWSLMPRLKSQLMSTRIDTQLRKPWEKIPNLDCAHSWGRDLKRGGSKFSKQLLPLPKAVGDAILCTRGQFTFYNFPLHKEYINLLRCEGVKWHRST